MATNKQLAKKQDELDNIKWRDSEEKGIDTCGTYGYCVMCDKQATYPCARAYYDFNSKNKPLEYRANVALSDLAQKLIALRISKGLSIPQVAKAVGVEPIELFKYENDKAKPSDEVLHDLIIYFDTIGKR